MRIRHLAYSALVFWTVAAQPSVSSAQIQVNKGDQFLNGFQGVWDGPPAGGEAARLSQNSVNGWRLNNRWLLFFLTERPYGSPQLTFTSETYVGYDPEAKRYEAHVFDTIGVSHYTGSRVGEKSLVLAMTAADGHTERLTLTQESPTAYVRLLETSRDGTQFTLFSSVRFTKPARAASRQNANK